MSSASIDELLLLPGRYRIDVGLYLFGRLQDQVEGAAFFTVGPGAISGPASAGRGDVRNRPDSTRVEVRRGISSSIRRPSLMRRTAALTHVLVGRWHARTPPGRGRVELGDFGRRLASLDRDEVSVYDVLVRRFLRPRRAAFAGRGLVLGLDAEPEWMDAFPANADVKVLSRDRRLRSGARGL